MPALMWRYLTALLYDRTSASCGLCGPHRVCGGASLSTGAGYDRDAKGRAKTTPARA
jgi:hypothetical protein